MPTALVALLGHHLTLLRSGLLGHDLLARYRVLMLDCFCFKAEEMTCSKTYTAYYNIHTPTTVEMTSPHTSPYVNTGSTNIPDAYNNTSTGNHSNRSDRLDLITITTAVLIFLNTHAIQKASKERIYLQRQTAPAHTHNEPRKQLDREVERIRIYIYLDIRYE